MRATALRTVMLLQAIEETDPAGELLPLADRAEATRETVKDQAMLKQAFAGGRLSRAAERVMVARAARLRSRVIIKSPVIDQILDASHGPRWIAQTLFVVSIGCGLLLSLLDGMGRINILAWPLVCLIAWNICAYVGAFTPGRRGSPAGSLYAVLTQRHARRLIAQSGRFHASLADPLERFATDWGRVAAPLFAQRGRRLFHVAAVCVAVGVVAGWTLRVLVFRDVVGWDSHFIGPRIVYWFVHVLYGPAAAVLGITLPVTAPEVEQLRWSATNPARDSLDWVHLLAATAAIYIVIPRIIALLGSTAKVWKLAGRLAPPGTLLPYARRVLLNATDDVATHVVVSVTPYAYSPDQATVDGLANLLTRVISASANIDLRPAINYGAPVADVTAVTAADWSVILCTLASTPDATAHGAMFVELRNRLLEGRSVAPLLIAIDESPFAGSMGVESPAAAAKLAARRKLWSDFVTGYGVPVCILPFAQFGREANIEQSVQEGVQASFWVPTAPEPH